MGVKCVSLVMDFGEIRHIRLLIKNIYNRDFTILKCDYELKDPSGQIEAFGPADIADHVLDVLVNPKLKGEYDVQFTYIIADETLIEHISLKVI